ncbi:MAG: hypothetical protein E7214_14790 [Clostridium sp.]|nr:hypothetical protein [Clostridium sp.]
MLCNLANIQAVTVSGFTEDRGHAWNLVKLDGEFYNCDITNDAGSNEDEIQGLDKKTVKKLKLNFLRSDAVLYSGIYKGDENTKITFPKANSTKYDNKFNFLNK